jgi:hypothetical protein
LSHKDFAHLPPTCSVYKGSLYPQKVIELIIRRAGVRCAAATVEKQYSNAETTAYSKRHFDGAARELRLALILVSISVAVLLLALAASYLLPSKEDGEIPSEAIGGE